MNKIFKFFSILRILHVCIITYYYVFGRQEWIVAISLTLNTQNDRLKVDLAIFRKKIKIS